MEDTDTSGLDTTDPEAATDNFAGITCSLREGGNKTVETAILPNLYHLFQTCRTGAVSEYGEIEETMSSAALSAVSDWIQRMMVK